MRSVLRKQLMFHSTSSRPGYIFLLSILAIGIIAVATTLSLLLLGWGAEQNGFAVVQSAQAWENAQTCIERTLRTLRRNLAYAGNETFILTEGTCSLNPIGGAHNQRRIICSQGNLGASTRRIEVELEKVLPSMIVTSWKEVSSFTKCP